MNQKNNELIDKILINVNAVYKTSQRKPIEKLPLRADLVDDLQLDSLDLAELSIRLEAEFGVNVFLGKLPATVNEILGRLGQKNAP